MFIELTDLEGDLMIMNINRILVVHINRWDCTTVQVSDKGYLVKETPVEIMAKIQEAKE